MSERNEVNAEYNVSADFTHERVKIEITERGTVIVSGSFSEEAARSFAAQLVRAADSIKKPEPPLPPLNEPQGKAPYR